ncbi:MAG: gamma-glutamyltransferase [Candidatus Thiodiazotropha lotti]|uniref:Glutathione hydrolase proenzyme n=1 Tax=Candidatus Thiodiazotropha lotti TaxID=2792787 RepID=A0A9E4N2F1_9GAMM|nr:gamma-glutamyltransferase [Candidatus Thiodiazotropha lotti]MCG7940775.1 gamma-glutamyltransferase [Candidatus Thiodiazotropha lotti]MCW4205248.1 gamma-glutamyltransferase [Candidatus Thiodiazotropha lotti]MCW4219919.1 gamma-glutamyltransferase [Candidatus Thiodiazotropha lotti]
MRLYKAPLWSLIILLGCYSQLWAAQKPAKAAIASAHPLATQAGHEILRKGGNAFDAAVAVTAVLAVVEPYSSGLGGGGFWLLHRASDGFQTMLDGRERAPLAAHRDLYLDAQGDVVADKSIDGALAAGIPGVPAALAHLTENYGRLPLADLLKPAIEVADMGFAVDDYYRRMATWRLPVLQSHDASAGQFLLQGEVPPAGHLIKQPDLAATLRVLAEQGADGFYRGELAQRLVDGVQSAGGIWTMQDLHDYRVVERRPIIGHYQGMRITSAAPPSSGGIAILTILNILQENNYAELPEPQKTHLLVEAMRRAYRDRAEYLGDPDYVQVPVEKLIHPLYGAGLARSIDMQRATPSPKQTEISTAEGQDTTHFSILDREGNRVAATLSINYPFGAGVVVPGTGVLLNDEMDDFSASPGVPNVYGLVGGEANAIEGGKRMLSSMTPTFVEDSQRIAILGTPGGSRIITMVLLGILEMAEGRGPQAWVSRPRFHHQYLPDVIQMETDALSETLIGQLTEMGHNFKPLKNRYGNMQAVVWDKSTGQIDAASDPRGVGMAKID